MKKLLLFTGVVFLFASLSMAQATFSPTVMEISCPAEINYDFGDEPLNINFNVSGVPGAFWLVINTHGKADEIVGIQNGFLGWHYVNNIDTTVYVSGRYQRELGDVKISWDGTNSDGAKVPEDTYSYYLWGYDDKTQRQMVTDYVPTSKSYDAKQNVFVTYDEQGLILEKPFIFGNRFFHDADDEVAWKRFGTAYKWELGGNPEDINNLATTWMPFFIDAAFASAYQYGQPVVDLQDNNYYYHHVRNDAASTRTVFKWKFVPGGDAEQDMEYMGFDNDVEWKAYPQPKGNERGAMATNQDGTDPYMYINQSTLHIFDQKYNPVICVNKELGEVVFEVEMNDFFMPEDGNERNEINGCTNATSIREGNNLLICSWMGCLQEMIDTTSLLEDPYAEDYTLWYNKNGDYFLDKWFWEDAATPWSCLGGFTWTYLINKGELDANMFPVFYRSAMGTVSATVLTQDGTGVADISFFGVDAEGFNTNSFLVDSGSQYDGIYCPPPLGEGQNIGNDLHGLAFVTFDSAGGLIIPGEVQPGVEEESLAAYSIEQNAPNPFNPTTTIGFTLAEAGDVSIDIYNVAGQKVDTLVSDFVESGSHSVVWDASGFSAGVYFYTIKSGEFSKTMKMTLLK